LPARLLDPAIARTYCGGENASVREKAGKVILSFLSEDEEGCSALSRSTAKGTASQ
jgi:hypothetical protein